MVIFRSRIVRRPTVLMQVIFVVLLNDEIGPNQLQHLHFTRWRRYASFKDTVILKELDSAAAHTGQFSSVSTKAKMFSVCLRWLCFLKLKQWSLQISNKNNLKSTICNSSCVPHLSKTILRNSVIFKITHYSCLMWTDVDILSAKLVHFRSLCFMRKGHSKSFVNDDS